MGWIVQAVTVSAVWFGLLLWIDPPGAGGMAAAGTSVAFALAWRDHRHDAERDEFEYDDEAELERARDGDLTWL